MDSENNKITINVYRFLFIKNNSLLNKVKSSKTIVQNNNYISDIFNNINSCKNVAMRKNKSFNLFSIC